MDEQDNAGKPSTPISTDLLDEVLTVREAAAFLRVNPKTLYNEISRGSFPARRVGKSLRVSRSALLDWLAQGQGCVSHRRVE